MSAGRTARGTEESRAEPPASPGPEPRRHRQEQAHARRTAADSRAGPARRSAGSSGRGGWSGRCSCSRTLVPTSSHPAARPHQADRTSTSRGPSRSGLAGVGTGDWAVIRSSGSLSTSNSGCDRSRPSAWRGLLPGGDSPCRPRDSRNDRLVPTATGLRRNRPCGTARARNGAGDHRPRHSSPRRAARRPGDGRPPRRRPAPRRRRGWTSSPRDET